MLLDLEAGPLDLSPQHWTCLLEAGPSAQLHSIRNYVFSGLGHSDVGLVTPALDLSFGCWAKENMFVSGLGGWRVGLVSPALDLFF